MGFLGENTCWKCQWKSARGVEKEKQSEEVLKSENDREKKRSVWREKGDSESENEREGRKKAHRQTQPSEGTRVSADVGFGTESPLDIIICSTGTV